MWGRLQGRLRLLQRRRGRTLYGKGWPGRLEGRRERPPRGRQRHWQELPKRHREPEECEREYGGGHWDMVVHFAAGGGGAGLGIICSAQRPCQISGGSARGLSV